VYDVYNFILMKTKEKFSQPSIFITTW